MQAGFKSRPSACKAHAHFTAGASRNTCYLSPFVTTASLGGSFHFPVSLSKKVRLERGRDLPGEGSGSERPGAEPAAVCTRARGPQLPPLPRPSPPRRSHLRRSRPRAPPAVNYSSRQDAGARTRTGASAMATVLSRALKLPGKESQPCDHRRLRGAWGDSEARLWGRSGPRPGGVAAGAPRRAGAAPGGLGSVATRGREGRTAGRGSRARGEPGRIQGRTAGGHAGLVAGSGRAPLRG